MKFYFPRLICLLGVMMLCPVAVMYGQDTIHITLPEAEKQFVQKNLLLLAERYNIDIAKAAVIQAKLYDNPVLSLNGNLYDPLNKKFFNVSNKTGQYDIALQQLVRLAGKRNKEVRLAETSISLSDDKFADLLRTLRYALRSNFYNLYYLQHSIKAYSKQIDALGKLQDAYDQLLKRSVVTLKDDIRIKSLLYSLKGEQTSLQNQLNEQQGSFQLLLQSNTIYFIADDPGDISPAIIDALNLQQLLDTAYTYRSDLHIAEKNILYNQQNYSLQKALAKPDITIGAEFDKRGSFVDNASFLTVSMDLPFFKRNQGNIRSAKFSIEQSQVIANQQKQSVEHDVQLAYSKLINTDKMLRTIDPAFENQFEQLLQGVTDNFQKKNISLVEFTDFYESYKNNILQFDQLRNDRMQALETLQFTVGKNLFNN